MYYRILSDNTTVPLFCQRRSPCTHKRRSKMAFPLPQVTAKKTVPVLKDFTCLAPIKMLGNNHGENKAPTRQITFIVVNNCLMQHYHKSHTFVTCV